jgi:prevent-host-death family protein
MYRMERLPIPEFNQHVDDVLARVEQGETVEITNEGKPIARIVPTDEILELTPRRGLTGDWPGTQPSPTDRPRPDGIFVLATPRGHNGCMTSVRQGDATRAV